MKKYIELEAAVSAFTNYLVATFGAVSHRTARTVECILKPIPAAPVREVVTCGECIFWNRPPSCEGLARCLTGESGVRYRAKYDFCSRGKRPDTRIEEGGPT